MYWVALRSLGDSHQDGIADPSSVLHWLSHKHGSELALTRVMWMVAMVGVNGVLRRACVEQRDLKMCRCCDGSSRYRGEEICPRRVEGCGAVAGPDAVLAETEDYVIEGVVDCVAG